MRIRGTVTAWARNSKTPVRALLLGTPLALALAILIFRGLQARYPGGFGDAAGFADLIQTSAPNVALWSHYFAAVRAPLTFLADPTPFHCAQIVSGGVPDGMVWGVHPYVIAAPLGAFVWVLGVSGASVGLFAIALSTACGIVAAVSYLALRRVWLPWVVAFAGLIVLWPVVNQSLLGQAYFDRLFFGPGVVLILATWAAVRGNRGAVWVAVGALVVSAVVVERASLIAGVAAVLYPVALTGRGFTKSRPAIVITSMGLVAIGWFVAWNRWINESIVGDYSGALTKAGLENTFHRLTTDPGSQQLTLFFVSVIPFLVLAALSPRGLPLAIVVVLPNILVTTGGAELTGFYTHYHQMYAPILVGLAAVGVARAAERWGFQRDPDRTRTDARYSVGILGGFALLILAVAGWSGIGQPPLGLAVELGNTAEALGVPSTLRRQQAQAKADGAMRIAASGARRASGGGIVAPDFLAPVLQALGVTAYGYFPFGLDRATVVLAPLAPGNHVAPVFPHGYPSGERAQNATMCADRYLARNFRLVSSLDGVGVFVRRTGRS